MPNEAEMFTVDEAELEERAPVPPAPVFSGPASIVSFAERRSAPPVSPPQCELRKSRWLRVVITGANSSSRTFHIRASQVSYALQEVMVSVPYDAPCNIYVSDSAGPTREER